MNTSDTHTNEKRNDNLTLIIDKLLSKGWTSQVDMAIAINNYWENVEDKYLYKKTILQEKKPLRSMTKSTKRKLMLMFKKTIRNQMGNIIMK